MNRDTTGIRLNRLAGQIGKSRLFAVLTTMTALLCLIVFSIWPCSAATKESALDQAREQPFVLPEPASPVGGIQGQGENVVVTDQDLAKAYREVFQAQARRREGLKTLQADKGSCYQVTLVSGRNLLAVKIQAKGDMVILTDSRGMVTSITKRQIVDIKKLANSYDPSNTAGAPQ